MKPILVAILSLTLLSCSKEKEIPTFRIADAAWAETTAATPENRQPRPLRWIPPETWEDETPGQFQIARYRIAPGITAAVSKFPDDAGGMVANVNRWREQVGLAPSPETGGDLIALEEGDTQARWFELKGAERSILAAIIPVDDETWFFKLDSSTPALETARPGFMELLKSVEIGSSAGAEIHAIDLHPPAGWEKREGNAMRFASYRIPASGPDGIDGDVSVVSVPGEGGSNLENVNLWRAQLRLSPLEKEDDPAATAMVRSPPPSSGPARSPGSSRSPAKPKWSRPTARGLWILSVMPESGERPYRGLFHVLGPSPCERSQVFDGGGSADAHGTGGNAGRAGRELRQVKYTHAMKTTWKGSRTQRIQGGIAPAP